MYRQCCYFDLVVVICKHIVQWNGTVVLAVRIYGIPYYPSLYTMIFFVFIFLHEDGGIVDINFKYRYL